MFQKIFIRSAFVYLLLILAIALTATESTKELKAEEKTTAEKPDVDLVICLDCSGSMSGLINLAREKIWEMINEFAKAKPHPNLRVALYNFGGNAAPENGHVIQMTNLTVDLDKVYEKLFALKTNGGTELVGRVLHESLEKLNWSKQPNALKIIFVAGNESANQDKTYNYLEMAGKAIESGTIVNAFYCGNPGDNIAPEWEQIAKRADGSYHAINQNDRIMAQLGAAPQDENLRKLNGRINSTYLPFGEGGAKAKEAQIAQDNNAKTQSKNAYAQRACSKANGMYRNSLWDLVDAMKEEKFDLEKIKDEELPEEMQKMTLVERKAHIQKKTEERTQIQKEILQLSKDRQEWVKQELKRLGKEDTFGKILTKMIREQAKTKNFEFEE
ncbi:VWA domain-containing protein [Planctomycetota bacterium]